MQVDRHRIDRDEVAARAACHAGIPGGGEDLTQPGQVAAHRAAGALRKAIAPHAVQKDVDRHRTVGLDEQGDQHAPLPGMAEVDRATVDPHIDVAEESELDRHPVGLPLLCWGFKVGARFVLDPSPILSA